MTMQEKVRSKAWRQVTCRKWTLTYLDGSIMQVLRTMMCDNSVNDAAGLVDAMKTLAFDNAIQDQYEANYDLADQNLDFEKEMEKTYKKIRETGDPLEWLTALVQSPLGRELFNNAEGYGFGVG